MAPTKKQKSAARKKGINRRKREAKARKRAAKRMEGVREVLEMDIVVTGGVVVAENIEEQQERIHSNLEELDSIVDGGLDDSVSENKYHHFFETEKVDNFGETKEVHPNVEGGLTWDYFFETEEGNYMEEENVEFPLDVNEGENLEDREQEGKEVNESLEENEEDGPVEGVGYYKLCCDHFDPYK